MCLAWRSEAATTYDGGPIPEPWMMDALIQAMSEYIAAAMVEWPLPFIRHLLLSISLFYLIHLFILYRELLLLQNNFGCCSFEVDRQFIPSCLIIIMILTVFQ